jgi:osmotically-inducible protein OsmY
MRRGVAGTLLLSFLLALSSEALAGAPDAWITARTKIALLTAEGMSVFDVGVDTIDGTVSLHGKVTSEAEKRKAEEITRAVPGVKEVRNLLQVVPAARQQIVAATDAWIRRKVQEALEKDRMLHESHVSVASVSDGVVVLSGDARDSMDHLHAIQIARGVEGVRRVASTVRIASDTRDLDIWNRHELRKSRHGILGAVSDVWITAQARLRLLSDDRLPALDVNVDTRDGIVTLFGTVPSAAARAAARDDARKIVGVKDVRDELQVVPPAKQEEVTARDDELQKKVRGALEQRPEMKRAVIRVEVKNRVARLTGTVPSVDHRLSAATVARRVAGIRAVKEDLDVSAITEEEKEEKEKRGKEEDEHDGDDDQDRAAP